MLRLVFTANDLVATRFLAEPAAPLEMKFALRAMRRGISTSWGPRWRAQAATAFPSSTTPARELLDPFSWSLSPNAIGPDFDEELERIMGMTAHDAHTELALFRASPHIGAPPFLRYALARDRDGMHRTRKMAKCAFTAMVAPYWQNLRANHHAQLTRYGQAVAQRGLRGALAASIPGARWTHNCLDIEAPAQQTIVLGGRGLVLAPVAFWTGAPVIGALDERPVVLAYPAPFHPTVSVDGESDSLATILGSTRAAVLRLLTKEHTTGEIARQLGISPASASQHTTALRKARLVDSRRDGKTVTHWATLLGLDLVAANAGGTQ